MMKPEQSQSSGAGSSQSAGRRSSHSLPDEGIMEVLWDSDGEEHVVYLCNLCNCGRRFPSKTSLAAHKRRAHFVYFICQLCFDLGKGREDFVMYGRDGVDAHFKKVHKKMGRERGLHSKFVKEHCAKVDPIENSEEGRASSDGQVNQEDASSATTSGAGNGTASAPGDGTGESAEGGVEDMDIGDTTTRPTGSLVDSDEGQEDGEEADTEAKERRLLQTLLDQKDKEIEALRQRRSQARSDKESKEEELTAAEEKLNAAQGKNQSLKDRLDTKESNLEQLQNESLEQAKKYNVLESKIDDLLLRAQTRKSAPEMEQEFKQKLAQLEEAKLEGSIELAVYQARIQKKEAQSNSLTKENGERQAHLSAVCRRLEVKDKEIEKLKRGSKMRGNGGHSFQN